MALRSCLLCLGLAAVASGGEADPLAAIAARMGVPAARVPRLARPPDLNTAGRFPGWAGPLHFVPLSGSRDASPVKTSGYLACDAERLYAAIRCEEPDMNAVPSKAVPKDGDVWTGDSVEFMLLPGLDPAGAYHHFAVNPAGSLHDAKANDKAWDSGAVVHVVRDASSWTVVLAVPYAAVGVKPGEGAPPLWRVNLHRLRPRRGGAAEMDVSWSPTHSRSNHVPSRFGLALVEGMGTFDPAATMAFLDQAERLQVLLRQTFDKDAAPFDSGAIVQGDGPNGATRFLRVEGKRQATLERNFGDIRGLQMACAYRTSPNQVGLVIHGNGTVVRACRPGKVEVLGRGLKVAQTTCRDADGASRAFGLGLDAYRFLRPYGH